MLKEENETSLSNVVLAVVQVKELIEAQFLNEKTRKIILNLIEMLPGLAEHSKSDKTQILTLCSELRTIRENPSSTLEDLKKIKGQLENFEKTALKFVENLTSLKASSTENIEDDVVQLRKKSSANLSVLDKDFDVKVLERTEFHVALQKIDKSELREFLNSRTDLEDQAKLYFPKQHRNIKEEIISEFVNLKEKKAFLHNANFSDYDPIANIYNGVIYVRQALDILPEEVRVKMLEYYAAEYKDIIDLTQKDLVNLFTKLGDDPNKEDQKLCDKIRYFRDEASSLFNFLKQRTTKHGTNDAPFQFDKKTTNLLQTTLNNIFETVKLTKLTEEIVSTKEEGALSKKIGELIGYFEKATKAQYLLYRTDIGALLGDTAKYKDIEVLQQAAGTYFPEKKFSNENKIIIAFIEFKSQYPCFQDNFKYIDPMMKMAITCNTAANTTGPLARLNNMSPEASQYFIEKHADVISSLTPKTMLDVFKGLFQEPLNEESVATCCKVLQFEEEVSGLSQILHIKAQQSSQSPDKQYKMSELKTEFTHLKNLLPNKISKDYVLERIKKKKMQVSEQQNITAVVSSEHNVASQTQNRHGKIFSDDSRIKSSPATITVVNTASQVGGNVHNQR